MFQFAIFRCLTNLCAAFYEVKHKRKIIAFKLILQVFIKKIYKKLLHKKGLAVFYVVGLWNFAQGRLPTIMIEQEEK
ncbi:MAG: hypothetical protein J6K78_06625, partial [Tidjanibacter sp.]|nr:hypothetical protein [Tidjanibacter sp.]